MARFRFSFWLDANKDDELLLMEEIDGLKAERSFTKTIRDGIRLIVDLRRGRFNVLFELFPHLENRLKPAAGGGSGDDDLKDIKAALNRLEQVTVQNAAPSGYVMAARESTTSGPRQLATPDVAAPTFDDDDDDMLLDVKRDTSTDSVSNFIKSAFAFQQ